MQKLSNEKALTFIDSFLTKITVEKTAEESPINATSKETGGEPAGTVPAKVSGTTDTSPGKTLDEKKPAEGLFGKEKSGDLDGIAGTNVEDPAAENNVNADAPHAATGDFGAASVDELKQKKVAEELTMINEFKRAQNLGNKILGKYAAQLEQAAAEATPAVGEADALLKQAAEEAYHDFVISYQAGILKRAQDEAAIQDALGVSPEEASGLLDEVAMEDPNAVLPAEAGAEMPPIDEIPATGNEPDADEDAILQALVEAGVTPEELASASDEVGAEGAPEGAGGEADEDAIIQALIEAGVTPEELAEVAGESGGAAPEGEMPPEMLEEKAAAELELLKQAKYGLDALKKGYEGAKTGAKAGYEGVKAAGKAVGRQAVHLKDVGTGMGVKTLPDDAGKMQKVKEYAKMLGVDLAAAGVATAAGVGAYKGGKALMGKKDKKEDKKASESNERHEILKDIVRVCRG